MFGVLLAKDLRRAIRNPLPWLINLLLPLVMTALIGLVFGGRSDGGALGRIRFAVVDEDKSILSTFLRNAANQREGGKYLEPTFMERKEAIREINANQTSAVLIIPTNFMRNYLAGREAVNLELIKNPAESIHPAVLEEVLGAVVTALNAISRNFSSEFPAWQSVLEGNGDYLKVAELIKHAGDKFATAKRFLNPPLVSYEKELPKTQTSNLREESPGTNATGSPRKNSKSAAPNTPGKIGPGETIFSYLLLGLSAMFLLFLANTAMADLYRELTQRTLERYLTLRESLVPFLTSKVIFSVVMLLLCAALMIEGGGLIFRIQWRAPFALACLVLSYACFASALFAVLVAIMPDERRASVLSNLAGMGLGLAGGCAFPPQQLPAFVREHITAHLPSFWFVDTARNLQHADSEVAWGWVIFKLAVVSVVLLVLAAILFKRKFQAGVRV